MYSNFSNGDNRRPSSYKYNPSNYRKQKPRIRRRTRNRIIIVITALVALVLVFALISSFFSCICSSCSSQNKDNTLSTATVGTKSTKATKSTTTADTTLTFNAPDIEDDNSDGTSSNGLYIWNKSAFELFYGTDDLAKTYAKTINKLKTKLGDDISVFDMVVPNHTEMGLPSRLKNTEAGVTSKPQSDYIKTVYKNLDKSVTAVNCYNKLSAHCNDYIYFNTDHHWTGLGAYYAYTAFTDATKQKAISLKDCEKKTIKGFTGSFITMLGSSSGLASDSVNYWVFPYEVPTTITNANGNTSELSSCYYLGEGSGSNSYGVFLWGDNPLEVIKSQSPDAKDDKIVVIHESYGNAMIPYLTYNYKEVYSIDFRSWSGDLAKYCKENEIKNVLFINGVMSSATAFQVESIGGLIK